MNEKKVIKMLKKIVKELSKQNCIKHNVVRHASECADGGEPLKSEGEVKGVSVCNHIWVTVRTTVGCAGVYTKSKCSKCGELKYD